MVYFKSFVKWRKIELQGCPPVIFNDFLNFHKLFVCITLLLVEIIAAFLNDAAFGANAGGGKNVDHVFHNGCFS